MAKVLVIVPVPLDEGGVDNRRAQLGACQLGPNIDFEFRAARVGPALFDSYHDFLLCDVGIYETGLRAQEEGFDAICIDTMSDSGMNALRSVLDIPVIGPARASYHMALMLGSTFSILTQWEPWKFSYTRTLREAELADRCVSIRSIDSPPDLRNLLGGKAEDVFPALLQEARACVDDGAHVICLGSTTMHEAGDYLAENLPVPVINPGPLTYKLAETLIGLRLRHSRNAYPRPHQQKDTLVQTMVDAGAEVETAAVD
jgi:Asp/Glu/hydantoin racemase